MWFQVLEFAVYCTVAKCSFYCRRRSRSSYDVHVFKNSALSLPLAPTVETRATELRVFSRSSPRHLVHAGLAIAAVTVFLDRAAEEQRSTFCTVADAELRMSYQIILKKLARALLLQQKKTYLVAVQKKDQFKRLEAHFQLSATRFASKEGTESAVVLPLTGVHQGNHLCLAKLWLNGKARSYSRITGYPPGKIEREEVVPVVDLIAKSAKKKKKLWAMQHRFSKRVVQWFRFGDTPWMQCRTMETYVHFP